MKVLITGLRKYRSQENVTNLVARVVPLLLIVSERTRPERVRKSLKRRQVSGHDFSRVVTMRLTSVFCAGEVLSLPKKYPRARQVSGHDFSRAVTMHLT